ncbi:MAG: hypothetical protein JZD40_04155, partial [Sulfolobus sp.]|nr:hypothetical protein [Sulfolobus sp.]
ELVYNHFPNLIRYVEEIGFEGPLVPIKDAEILDPFKKEVSDKVVREFMSFFSGKIGITGSMLYSDKFNDMDFVSLNEDDYETLVDLRKREITSPLTFYKEDEVEGLNKNDFLSLKRNRFLEGIYKNIPYTFKIVKCEDFGVVLGKESFEGVVEIVRSEKPFSLPVKYYTDKGIYLTSFRVRYTELKEGTRIYVNGILLKRDKFLDLDLDIAKEVRVL